jgi:peptide-methionine (S)-S-oxide reductase
MAIQHATFAAGCFWGVQEDFASLRGVLTTEVGYTGGITLNPTYDQVCTGETGHAEAVHITFDDTIISFDKLLDFFFAIHNPTTLNRQGLDIGSQYRSAIFYHTDLQRKSAERSLQSRQLHIGKKIVTLIEKAGVFYRAEEYHQDYLKKRLK